MNKKPLTKKQLLDGLYNAQAQRDAALKELKDLRAEVTPLSKVRWEQEHMRVEMIKKTLALHKNGNGDGVLDLLKRIMAFPIVQFQMGMDIVFQRPSGEQPMPSGEFKK